MKTNLSMIEGLKSQKPESWGEFYDEYAPIIYSFSRQRGCCEHDARDVVQLTAIRLLKYLASFTYDPDRQGGFRAYVLTVARGIIARSIVKPYAREVLTEDPSILTPLHEILGDGDTQGQSQQGELVRLALMRYQEKAQPRRFACLVEVTLKKRPPRVVAPELGIAAADVSRESYTGKQELIAVAEQLKREFATGEFCFGIDSELTRSAQIEIGFEQHAQRRVLFKMVARLIELVGPPGDPHADGLLLVDGETPKRWVALDHSPFRIGRLPKNELTIAQDGISRIHCELSSDEAWTLHDRSKNGMIVNTERVTAPVHLKDGDILFLGPKIRLLFLAAEVDA